MRYLIVHPEAGIYLGNAMGLGFWSKWDAVGQDAAVTFPDPESAIQHVASWDKTLTSMGPLEMMYVPVRASLGDYATIEDCVAAGLEAWNPDMVPDFQGEWQ